MEEAQKSAEEVEVHNVNDGPQETPEDVDIEVPSFDEAVADKNVDPADAPAMLFGLYYPKFCQGVDMLSNKSLRRLIKSLVGVPLESNTPNLKIQIEKTCFAIGEKLHCDTYYFVKIFLYFFHHEIHYM